MVIYETISGNLPFHKDTDLTVFVKVLEGGRPSRGVRFTDTLWTMLELCWTPQPNARPSIEDVLQCLMTVSNFPEPPPVVDEGVMDVDEWDSENDSFGLPTQTATPAPHQHQILQTDDHVRAAAEQFSSVTSL